MFMEQRNIIDNIKVNNNITCGNLYCYSIKCVLDNLGFSNIFNNFNADLDYVPLLAQRLGDQYVQQWHVVLSSQSNMEYYTIFKCDFMKSIWIVLVIITLSAFFLSSEYIHII